MFGVKTDRCDAGAERLNIQGLTLAWNWTPDLHLAPLCPHPAEFILVGTSTYCPRGSQESFYM